jgi:hypothetical protein
MSKKYLRRAKAKLAMRITGYEQACKTRQDRGRGFRKPGSLQRAR